MYYADDNILHLEDDDQCGFCENYKNAVACPLLQALAFGYVSLEGSLVVTNCGFFKEHKRHLKIVRND